MKKHPLKLIVEFGVGAAALIAAGAWLLRGDSASSCSEDSYRKKVVDAARSQVGKRDLDTYFADAAPQFVGQHPEWCGIFALWALHQAGLAKSKQWKTGLGFVEVPPALPKTHDPKPGDIVYYIKYSHHAVVGAVNDDGTIEAINGNGQGGVVSLSRPKIADATSIYSIFKLIEEAQAQAGCKS